MLDAFLSEGNFKQSPLLILIGPLVKAGLLAWCLTSRLNLVESLGKPSLRSRPQATKYIDGFSCS